MWVIMKQYRYLVEVEGGKGAGRHCQFEGRRGKGRCWDDDSLYLVLYS